MEITTFSKCACANCGHVIEYLPAKAGEIVECPKCHEKSQLPEVQKLGIIEVLGPPVPTTRTCPVCRNEMPIWVKDCLTCADRRKKKKLLIAIGAASAVVCLAVVYFTYLRPRKPEPVVTYEQPPPRLPKSINDLKPGRFNLERRHGSDLALAVGDIVNISENHHSQIRADLDLLDQTGTKIGTVSDICTALGPHETWHLVVTVTETNAYSLRFVSLKEQ